MFKPAPLLRPVATRFSSPANSRCQSRSPNSRSTHLHAPPWKFPPPIGLPSLPLFSTARSVEQTQQLHASAILHASLPHTLSICASLMLSYASFGHPAASRLLFYQTPPIHRTAFLCNTLTRALTIAVDDVRLLFEAYNWMVRNGVRPDLHTFPIVLKACVNTCEARKGMEVHGKVLKSGFDSDVYVGNTLLLFYGRSGDLQGAERVFDEMLEPDAVSWNTLFGVISIEGSFCKCLSLFREMNCSSGFKPDAVTVITILPMCAEFEDEATASEIHCYSVKMGFYLQVTIGNALVDVYGKCGNTKASKLVFDEMDCRNVVSWNALIVAFSADEDSLEMLRLMIDEGQRLDAITISSVLPLLAKLQLPNAGKEIHAYAIRMGVIDTDIFVANSLIHMYAKSGHLTEASCVFTMLETKNLFSWNAMASNLATNGLESSAVGLIRKMQIDGEIPDSITLVNVLPACANAGFLRQGKEIHAWSIRTGHAHNHVVSNALTDMYLKCGCLNLARTVFDVSFTDEVTYNTLIVGYSKTRNCEGSLHLFLEMGRLGLRRDDVSFMGTLSACANMGAIKPGKEIHGLSVRKAFNSHPIVANSLLELYTKCGQINIARRVFEGIQKKDVASWNIMILAHGMLCELDTTFSLFEAMRKEGMSHDSGSYLAVLSACSHGGLVERGRQYFCEMVEDQQIVPTLAHYACMVDLLGRAGHLEESVRLIRGLPVVPDACVWGALLGACRVHGDFLLGAWAAGHLFKLEPWHGGYSVLLSNMHAEAGQWDEASRVRKLIGLRDVKRHPGCSWVQIHGD